MSSDIEIRYVRPGDEAMFARVAVDVFDAEIDPHLLTTYLAEPGHCLFVAIHDGCVVGQCRGMVQRHPDKAAELYIDNLGVTPALQRRGIATRLLDAICGYGTSAGCAALWVGTETDNEEARSFYESLGARSETFTLYARDL